MNAAPDAANGEPRPPVNGWREDPIDFDLRDFLRRGRLEGVVPGQTIDEVRRSVPAPKRWALTTGAESPLWSYGSIDVIFRDGHLHSISCDDLARFGEEKLADGIIVEPWFLAPAVPPTLREVMRFLTDESISFSGGDVPPPLHQQRYDLVIGERGLRMCFEPDDELPDDANEETWRATAFWSER